MNSLIFKRNDVLLCSVLAWCAVIVLSVAQWNAFEILNVFGFLGLIILPGTLTIIALRMRGLPPWAYIGLMVGFSLIELIAVVLAGNTFLPYIGVARPLDQLPLLLELSVLIFVLCWIVYARMGQDEMEIPATFFEGARDRIIAFLPSLFVAMSVVGAIRLNNGASGTVTLVMLMCMAVYAAVLVYYAEELGTNVIATALFFMALSLLLMTSLRGWYITGHDIQNEYRVFELTKNNGIWTIANYRDAYNACMSITILPTIFANILSLADPYVYKVLFQILFAIVPSIIYLNVRRYVSSAVAFLTAFYFLAFPTFYTDMTFINRQEIAFIFLALMLYVIFETRISLVLRRALFLLLGIGMVLSHYSTTYTVVATLIFLVCMQPIIVWLGPYVRKIRWFSGSAIPALGRADFVYKPAITFWMVAILTAASFFWSGIVTNTASNSIVAVVEATLAAVKSNTKEDAQSSDVNSSLLSYQEVDYSTLFQEYESSVIASRATAPVGEYYDAATYADYPIQLAPAETVPLTPLGNFLSSKGINVPNDTYLFHQVSAKLLQVLIVVGFLFVLFSSRFMEELLDTEFVLLAVASLIMLAAIVVLPVLSVQYGLLRAFQQSLMFLGLFLVIGCLALMAKFKNKNVGIVLASVLAIVFFLSETGSLTQLFGGYDPQLSLNNNGSYYDVYDVHEGDVVGIDWLSEQMQEMPGDVQASTQSNFYANQEGTSLDPLSPSDDFYPGLIRRDSYVLLDYAAVHKQQATISYNGTQVAYIYPVQFLDDNKDLIYDNGDAEIYR